MENLDNFKTLSIGEQFTQLVMEDIGKKFVYKWNHRFDTMPITKPSEPEPLKLHYHEVIELGFKREEAPDKIFEEQNGYEYFIVTLNIGIYAFGWDIETHEITLYKGIDKFSVISTKSELLSLISLLKPVNKNE